MKNIKLIIVFVIFGYSGLLAQEYHFGIRGGTNFGKIVGPSEEGVEENHTWGNGFHFGIEALYSFNDYVSIGTEINYNQVGSQYHYEGPSYQIFLDKYILKNDNVTIDLFISNSYIDIPLNVYFKPIKKLEFKLGGYIGFLISPTANGKMKFGEKFNQILKYNYYSDKTKNIYERNYGTVAVKTLNEEGDTIIRETNKVAKAYFQYPPSDYENNGSYYKTINLGLNAGVNYYINSSLFLGLNLQYGLSDITNNKLDRSLKEIGGNEDTQFEGDDYLIYRDDIDKILNLQISLGFRF